MSTCLSIFVYMYVEICSTPEDGDAFLSPCWCQLSGTLYIHSLHHLSRPLSESPRVCLDCILGFLLPLFVFMVLLLRCFTLPLCMMCLCLLYHRYIARGRRDGESMKDLENRRKEDCTIRVTNLSEDVKDEDLTELFGKIGKIERIYLAKHKSVVFPLTTSPPPPSIDLSVSSLSICLSLSPVDFSLSLSFQSLFFGSVSTRGLVFRSLHYRVLSLVSLCMLHALSCFAPYTDIHMPRYVYISMYMFFFWRFFFFLFLLSFSEVAWVGMSFVHRLCGVSTHTALLLSGRRSAVKALPSLLTNAGMMLYGLSASLIAMDTITFFLM